MQHGAGRGAGEGTSAPLVWEPVLTIEPAPALMASLDRFRTLRALIFFTFIRACGLVARLVWGLRVAGQEKLPATGACILCPNHQSYFDGFVLTSALPFHALRRIFFVGASEYFQTPLTRWLARMANIVPVDPDANLVTAMQAGAAGLRSGNVLVLFPEGERTIDGEVKKFRKGAAILAAHLRVPIVPVALDGLYPLWPRSRPLNWRACLPWRAARVSCTFGTPLMVAPGAYAEGTAALHDAVAELVDRTRREP